MTANPERPVPRAAYIHVPFCRHRCGYCNFTLVAGRDDLIDDYLTGIELELAGLGQPREVDTLYVGGGTPSHLGTEDLARLLAGVLRWHPLADGGELTVEANPADLNEARRDVLADHGTTRISLGAQSFDQTKLARLERDHTPDDIFRSVALFRARRVDIALDLIFAAPGETLAAFEADVDAMLSVHPEHVSTYGLTYEPQTAFYTRLKRGALCEVDEEVQRRMYLTAIDKFQQAGYEHYEVSNFAMEGKRSRHNQVYWTGDSYFAAGPGASRFIDGRRETNYRSVTTYLHRVLAGASPTQEVDDLAPTERAREMIVIGLRRIEGIGRREFRLRFGFEIDQLCGETIRRQVLAGNLVDDGERIALTRTGLLVSDSLWPDFL